jgi:oxygen-independent coproporphyrinogen-3 oxidase
MSSISQAEDFYWQNHKDLPEHHAELMPDICRCIAGYLMTAEDRIRRTVIMRLMCDLGLDYSAISKMIGVDFKKHFAAEIESLDDMEVDGLLLKTPAGIAITDLGRLLIRNIAMRFDAYATTRKENRFSRTI